MSLNIAQLIRNGVDLAFDLTPDVQKSGTYRRRDGATYDPATGQQTANDTTAAVTFIVSPYSEDEIDGESIQLGDERVTIDNRVLVAAGIANLGKDDILEETGGPTRQVVSWFIDPTETVAIIHTRRLGE